MHNSNFLGGQMIKRTLALSAVAAIIGALSMPVIAAPAKGAGGKAGAPGQQAKQPDAGPAKTFAPGQWKKLPVLCDDGSTPAPDGDCPPPPS